MDTQKIKDKIRKLLKLAGSPSESEAQAALLKARELMMKYKLEHLDISEEQAANTKIIQIKTEVTFTKYTDNWISTLASIIAEHHCCASYNSHTYKAKRRHVCFMGEETDVKLVEQIFYYAKYCIYKVINSIRSKYYTLGYNITDLRPITDSYAKGFICGLEDQYEEQNSKNQEWGLVAVVPEDVQKFIDNLKGVPYPSRELDVIQYLKGRQDGYNFTMNDKIGNSKLDLQEEVNNSEPIEY